MQPLQAHRIRRSTVRVRAPSTTEAFALRARLRAVLDDAVVPALERGLDAVAIGEEVLRLPKLELRVKLRDLADLGELSARLPEAVAIALREALEQRGVAQKAGGRAQPAQVEASRTPLLEANIELLARYFATGTAPWSLAHLPPSELTRALQAIAATDLPAALHCALEGEAGEAHRFAVFARALALLEASVSPRALEVMSACSSAPAEERAELLAAVRAVVDVPILGGLGTTHARLSLAAALFASASALNAAPALRARLRSIAAQHALPEPLEVRLIAALPVAAARLIERRLEPSSAALLPPSRPAAPAAPQPSAAHLKRVERAPAELSGQPARSAVDVASAQAPPPRAAHTAHAPNAAPLGQWVSHAGLVLLHPYVPRFLESVGVRAAKATQLDPSLLPRAAALLHALAVGEDAPQELELDLIKVLLGLSPQDALPIAGGLVRASDREEIDALLRAAIAHWSALRSTTPAGLRASFLQRRGLLYDEGACLRLRVESHGFDVLLRQLPWSISTVKLPWMPRPLFIEWSTP